MSYKGRYKPLNLIKYKGDPSQIIYRSEWERRFMVYCDTHKDILEWSSEELAIPYRSLIDNRIHRYWPDFKIKYKTKDNNIKTMIIEIKPLHQVKPPSQPTKKNKKYIKEVVTYGTNISKWQSAQEYCRLRNWTFKILTEDEIYGKY